MLTAENVHNVRETKLPGRDMLLLLHLKGKQLDDLYTEIRSQYKFPVKNIKYNLNEFVRGQPVQIDDKTVILSDKDLANMINHIIHINPNVRVAVFLLKDGSMVMPTESPPNATAAVYCIDPDIQKFAEALINSTAVAEIWEDDSGEEDDNLYQDPDVYMERILMLNDETEKTEKIARDLKYNDEYSEEYKIFAHLPTKRDDAQLAWTLGHSQEGIFKELGKNFNIPDYHETSEYSQEMAEKSWLPATNNILKTIFENGDFLRTLGITLPQDEGVGTDYEYYAEADLYNEPEDTMTAVEKKAFYDALPPGMREEIMQQETAQRRRIHPEGNPLAEYYFRMNSSYDPAAFAAGLFEDEEVEEVEEVEVEEVDDSGDEEEDGKSNFIEVAIGELMDKEVLPTALIEKLELLQVLLEEFYDIVEESEADTPENYLKALQKTLLFRQLCQCGKEGIKEKIQDALKVSKVDIPDETSLVPGQIETTLRREFVLGERQGMPYGKVVRVYSVGDGSCYFWSCAQGYYQSREHRPVPLNDQRQDEWAVSPNQTILADYALDLRIGDAEWNDPSLGSMLNISQKGPTVQTYWWFVFNLYGVPPPDTSGIPPVLYELDGIQYKRQLYWSLKDICVSSGGTGVCLNARGPEVNRRRSRIDCDAYSSSGDLTCFKASGNFDNDAALLNTFYNELRKFNIWRSWMKMCTFANGEKTKFEGLVALKLEEILAIPGIKILIETWLSAKDPKSTVVTSRPRMRRHRGTPIRSPFRMSNKKLANESFRKNCEINRTPELKIRIRNVCGLLGTDLLWDPEIPFPIVPRGLTYEWSPDNDSPNYIVAGQQPLNFGEDDANDVLKILEDNIENVMREHRDIMPLPIFQRMRSRLCSKTFKSKNPVKKSLMIGKFPSFVLNNDSPVLYSEHDLTNGDEWNIRANVERIAYVSSAAVEEWGAGNDGPCVLRINGAGTQALTGIATFRNKGFLFVEYDGNHYEGLGYHTDDNNKIVNSYWNDYNNLPRELQDNIAAEWYLVRSHVEPEFNDEVLFRLTKSGNDVGDDLNFSPGFITIDGRRNDLYQIVTLANPGISDSRPSYYNKYTAMINGQPTGKIFSLLTRTTHVRDLTEKEIAETERIEIRDSQQESSIWVIREVFFGFTQNQDFVVALNNLLDDESKILLTGLDLTVQGQESNYNLINMLEFMDNEGRKNSVKEVLQHYLARINANTFARGALTEAVVEEVVEEEVVEVVDEESDEAMLALALAMSMEVVEEVVGEEDEEAEPIPWICWSDYPVLYLPNLGGDILTIEGIQNGIKNLLETTEGFQDAENIDSPGRVEWLRFAYENRTNTVRLEKVREHRVAREDAIPYIACPKMVYDNGKVMWAVNEPLLNDVPAEAEYQNLLNEFSGYKLTREQAGWDIRTNCYDLLTSGYKKYALVELKRALEDSEDALVAIKDLTFIKSMKGDQDVLKSLLEDLNALDYQPIEGWGLTGNGMEEILESRLPKIDQEWKYDVISRCLDDAIKKGYITSGLFRGLPSNAVNSMFLALFWRFIAAFETFLENDGEIKKFNQQVKAELETYISKKSGKTNKKVFDKQSEDLQNYDSSNERFIISKAFCDQLKDFIEEQVDPFVNNEKAEIAKSSVKLKKTMKTLSGIIIGRISSVLATWCDLYFLFPHKKSNGILERGKKKEETPKKKKKKK